MNDMTKQLLIRGLDDWVNAYELVWIAKEFGGAANDDAAFELAVATLRTVLEGGLMRAGDLTRDGFSSWDLEPEEALHRIVREWRDLGRAPRLGELCWLQNTAEGNEQARSLLS